MADNDRAEAQPESSPKTTPSPGPRKTRFIFKLLGLCLVGIAAWLGSYVYRYGTLPDLTDYQQQQKLLKQASEDARSARDATTTAATKIASWAERGLADLQKLIKGKPPETKEEAEALVTESQQGLQKKGEKTPPPPPVDKATPAAPAQPLANPPFTRAKAEYRLGQEAYRLALEVYVQTDPSAPQEQVQKYLRKAEPLFVRCLDALERARKEGGSGPEIDSLEQKAAIRLYDCRKRMTLAR